MMLYISSFPDDVMYDLHAKEGSIHKCQMGGFWRLDEKPRQRCFLSPGKVESAPGHLGRDQGIL